MPQKQAQKCNRSAPNLRCADLSAGPRKLTLAGSREQAPGPEEGSLIPKMPRFYCNSVQWP